MTRALLVMMIVGAAHTANAATAVEADTAIVVRSFDYSTRSDADIAQAQREVDAIFRRARIAVRWLDCRVPGRAGAPCTEPLIAGRELLLRIVDRMHADACVPGGVLALGESLLDGHERGGVLMTVELCAVRAVAAGSGTAIATLTGRAIAHEIGHLLLATSSHARTGLMRARWTREELRGVKPANWDFSRPEANQMRKALLRAQTAN
jgi:hypothetical protein